MPTLPIAATLKAGESREVTATMPRDGLHAAETPQGFHFAPILAAHERLRPTACVSPTMRRSPNGPGSRSMRSPARSAIPRSPLPMTSRRPTGASPAKRRSPSATCASPPATTSSPRSRRRRDARRRRDPLHPGRDGHSDGDVALHALTDAVLGALAEGDIGVHFPPSDTQWQGASSDVFLADAAAGWRRGAAGSHTSISPWSPRRQGRRTALPFAPASPPSAASVDRVSIKATTNEGLGFIGRGEGIAAFATATVRLPFTEAP